MDLISKSVNMGHENISKKIGSILDIPYADIESLDSFKWSLCNQGVAALQDSNIWNGKYGQNIHYFLKNLESTKNVSKYKVFDSNECIKVILPGYEEPGYCAIGSKGDRNNAFIEEGYELILSTGYYDWLDKVFGCLILTGEPESNYHISSSQRDTPGTIYSQRFRSINEAAEVIVHESAHSALNLIFEGTGEMKSILTSNREYFSPWKDTLRPEFGFLHSVFAFSQVLFLRDYLTIDNKLLISNLNQVRLDLNHSLEHIDNDTLKDIFQNIYSNIDRITYD